jgi:capsular polysaccharide biosynthesis protein
MRTSFPQRYAVIQPAQVPLRPTRPNATSAMLGALLAGAALGVFLALALHLREGRIHRAWQIRHQLKIPVLSEVRARRTEASGQEAPGA